MKLAGLVANALAAAGTVGAVVVALHLARTTQREARRSEKQRALVELTDGIMCQLHERRPILGGGALVAGGPAMHNLQLPLLSLPRTMATVPRLAVGESLDPARLAKADRYLTRAHPPRLRRRPDGRPMTPEIRGHALRELRDDLAGGLA